MRIITRKEATRLDLVRYFTGKPCIRGHVSERWRKGGHCVACVAMNREKLLAYNKAYYQETREYSKLYNQVFKK